MDHGSIYSYLNYLRRKDPIGGSISIPEYNRIAEIAAFKYFKKIFGLPEQYQKGAKDPIFGFGLNTIAEEKIRPLKVLPTSLVVDSNGYADYPPNYFRKSACGYDHVVQGGTTRPIVVTFGNDDYFKEREVSSIDPPSLIDPVGNLHATKIRFLPKSLQGTDIKLEYIKFPTVPVMGYVPDYSTAEQVYVDRGAYCQILTPGNAGNTITLSSGAVTFGAYTTILGDTAEDVMIGLTNAINVNTISHNIRAVYDREKVVLIDNILGTYSAFTTAPTGAITLNKSASFSSWSTQFDWENDLEAIDDIAQLMLDMMGISNRDIPITQWAKQEQAT